MQRAHNWSKRCLAMVVLSAAVGYVLPAVAVDAAETRTTIVSLPVGTQVAGLAVGAGALWVANGRACTVLRIDPETNQLVASIRIAEPSPTCDRCWGAVAAVGDVVWAAMDAAGPRFSVSTYLRTVSRRRSTLACCPRR